MTTWLSDASANRHIKTYVKDFLDLSGNLTVRNGDFDISGGDATISGSVGIGTTSPGYKMDIVGTDTMLRLTNDLSGGRTTQIFKTDDADWEIGARGSTNGDAPSSFYIYDTDYRMVIDNTGNVGIGTNSPAAKLDVNGSMRSGYDSDTLSYFGRVAIGGNPGSSHEPDHAYFSHIDQQGATEYALRQNSTGTTIINSATGANLNFRIANSTKMTMNSSGYVGIGTTSPTTKLHVHEDSTSTNTMIKLSHSTTGTGNDSDGFDLVLERTSNDMYLIQRENADMFFRTNNTDRMMITNNGRVGIGTTSPNSVAKLHVAAGSGTYDFGATIKYFNDDSTEIELKTNTSLGSISIVADNDIVTGDAIAAYSDKRIKKDIVEIDDASSLEKLRLLRPSYYKYKDPIKRGYSVVEGFIAQEVKEVLPYAVKLIEEYIPNIYEKGTYTQDTSGNEIITFSQFNTANLELDASGNVFADLKLYDASNNQIKTTIKETISSNQISIMNKSQEIPEQIFIYGQHVDNFNYLQKERIFTVGISALQEVDRQQQADKARIVSLETQLADVITRLTALESA